MERAQTKPVLYEKIELVLFIFVVLFRFLIVSCRNCDGIKFFSLFLKNVVVIVCGCGYISEALSPRQISCKGQ